MKEQHSARRRRWKGPMRETNERAAFGKEEEKDIERTNQIAAFRKRKENRL